MTCLDRIMRGLFLALFKRSHYNGFREDMLVVGLPALEDDNNLGKAIDATDNRRKKRGDDGGQNCNL